MNTTLASRMGHAAGCSDIEKICNPPMGLLISARAQRKQYIAYPPVRLWVFVTTNVFYTLDFAEAHCRVTKVGILHNQV